MTNKIVLPDHCTYWADIFTPPDRVPVVYDGLVWILLTRGLVTICDVDCLSLVSDRRWFAWLDVARIDQTGRVDGVYAMSRRKVGEEGSRNISLHRLIVQAERGEIVDHINLDFLDNRRENLRRVTARQNKQNGRMYTNNRAGFKGVDRRSDNRFRARIRVDGKLLYLGTYSTPETAARVYDKAAAEHFGPFAHTNF